MLYSVNGQTVLDMSYDSLNVLERIVDGNLRQNAHNAESNEDPTHYPRPVLPESVQIEFENFRNELRAVLQRRTPAPVAVSTNVEDLL